MYLYLNVAPLFVLELSNIRYGFAWGHSTQGRLQRNVWITKTLRKMPCYERGFEPETIVS